MSVTNRFIEIFGLAARQAGLVARYLQQDVSLRIKKGEQSPEGEALTAVDLAAQDVVLLLLHSAFAGSAVDTEEDTESVRLFKPYSRGRPLIVVDPIDGTLNYSRGFKEYAVMAAWLENEMYRAALVHFPALQETYWARAGSGCRKQNTGAGGPLSIGPLSKRVRVTPTVPERYRHALNHIGFEVIVSRCSAFDSSAPIAGHEAAALSIGRPSRRRAIGFLLTTEAGGVVRIGDRWWKGEDPLGLPADDKPTVVAGNRETAERITNELDRL